MANAETGPTALAHLRAGVRLLEVADGTVWHIDRLHRATSYSAVAVHLSAAGRKERVVDAGTLLSARDGADDWRFATEQA